MRLLCSLLLATREGSLSLGNTSDLLDSALDFLSLLSAGLAPNDVAVLYNTVGSDAPFITKDLYDGDALPKGKSTPELECVSGNLHV